MSLLLIDPPVDTQLLSTITTTTTVEVAVIIVLVYICWTLFLGIGLRYVDMDSRSLAPILSHYSTLLLLFLWVLFMPSFLLYFIQQITLARWLCAESCRYSVQGVLTTASSHLHWFPRRTLLWCGLILPFSLERMLSPPSKLWKTTILSLHSSPSLSSLRTELPCSAFLGQSTECPPFSEPRHLLQSVDHPVLSP